MRIRLLRFVISALASAALFSGCAGGGSSVTQSAGAVPSTVQRGTVSDAPDVFGHLAPSAVRRTMSVTACVTPGTGAFVGGGSSNVAGGEESFVGDGLDNEACDQYSAIAGGFDNAIGGSSGSMYTGFIGAGHHNVLSGQT